MFAHLAQNVAWALLIVAVSLTVGAAGYHRLEGMRWLDAYYNAAMILTTMGPASELKHDSAKVFVIFYALFASIGFIATVTLMFAPVVRRFLHRLHLEIKD